MEMIRFIFWEAAKVLALVFLALVAAKATKALAIPKAWIKPVLYALILVMVGFGAWFVGNDVAAEVYMWTGNSNLARGDLVKAYSNTLQAVRLRPNNLAYWHALTRTKFRLHQAQSILDDEASVRALSGGNLDEEDEYEFALCDYYLGQYDKAVATTLRLIRQNPSYAAPYVLQGLAYTAQKKFPEAQQSFLAVLQLFPNNQAAVENLARAYYLAGNRQQALAVLDDTQKFAFPAPVRQRFLALKGLYEQ